MCACDKGGTGGSEGGWGARERGRNSLNWRRMRGGGVRETEREKLKRGKQSEQPAELRAFMMLSSFLDFVPIGLSLSLPLFLT